MGWALATLQTYARQNYRVSLTPTEAAQYRQRFFDAYPGLRHWHRQTGATSRQKPARWPDDAV